MFPTQISDPVCFSELHAGSHRLEPQPGSSWAGYPTLLGACSQRPSRDLGDGPTPHHIHWVVTDPWWRTLGFTTLAPGCETVPLKLLPILG